jgi:site-specific recombinase XerD
LTFKDAGDLLVLESASRRLSKSTQKFYSDRTDAIVRIIGNKPAERICVTDLRRALTECPERSSPLNYRFLKRLFNFLIDEEVIKANPMANLKPPKIEQKVIEPLNQEQLQKLFRVARSARGFMGIRDSAILATLAGTGIRREELCNLRDEDVRLKDSVMLIHGKGRKQRLIPIPVHLTKLLARYNATRRQSRVWNPKCNRFFRARHGGAVTPDAPTQLMVELGNHAGIKLHPHLLRHAFATMFMANDGADVLTLRAICGWRTLAMATRYSHTTMPKLQRSMDSFSPSCE